MTICAALGPGDVDLPLEVVDAAIEFSRKDGLLVFTVNAGLETPRIGGTKAFFLVLATTGRRRIGRI